MDRQSSNYDSSSEIDQISEFSLNDFKLDQDTLEPIFHLTIDKDVKDIKNCVQAISLNICRNI